MKNSRGWMSFPTALAAMTAALVLVVVACTAEAPVATEAQDASEPISAAGAQVASEPQAEEVVAIWIDRDGTVQVNDDIHPIDGVSETVGSLDPKKTVVSLEAHQAAPYRVVAEVQEELQVAGLLRVVFTRVESEAQRSPARDVATLLDAGLAVVLPDVNSPEMPLVDIRELAARNPTNILFLEVLPTGIVAARLGADPSVREIAPADVQALWRQEVAPNPNLIALLETHHDAEYRHMYDVLDALQRTEATRFSLQVAE